jgi:hypothetical protein
MGGGSINSLRAAQWVYPRFFDNNHERPSDSAELQPFARLTNQREANKIGVAMQARATGINAADSLPGYDCGACHIGKMVFDGETVFRACSKTVFDVK